MEHYVEKPETFVSNTINCGVYVLGIGVLDHMKVIYVLDNHRQFRGNLHRKLSVFISLVINPTSSLDVILTFWISMYSLLIGDVYSVVCAVTNFSSMLYLLIKLY